jgi:arginase
VSQYICIGVPYFLGERLEQRSEVITVETSGFAQEIGAPWVNIRPDFTADTDPVVAVNRALAATIKQHSGCLPVIFASDCVSALGAVKGLEDVNPAVLWLDAHGDFNTWETTPSGFLGGMPLAMLVGRGAMDLMEDVELPPIAEDDVIITDARDLDPEEGEMLRASRLTHLPQIDDLLTVPLPDKPLYIHFDTDVIDPAQMPGMNYPAPGGPSVESTAATLERVARDGQPAGIFFTLWDDSHRTEGRALQATLQLARAFISGHAQSSQT